MSLIFLVMLLCLMDDQQATQLIFPVTGKYAEQAAVQEKQVLEIKPDYYVVMFTASYCGPCRDYKDSGKLDQLKAAGYPATLIDIQQDSSFYYGAVPKFWICKNKQRVHEFPAGTIPPDVILRKIRDLKEKEK